MPSWRGQRPGHHRHRRSFLPLRRAEKGSEADGRGSGANNVGLHQLDGGTGFMPDSRIARPIAETELSDRDYTNL
jgi:hypothetical protein